ncbi:MAG: hypothetical protein QOD92_3123 [Acidimicrobiaceae bacterium]|jgi:hypothetical protein
MNPYLGGRFDSFDGSYSYLYAGDTASVAVAETLLRYVPATDIRKPRLVRKREIKDKQLSEVLVLKPLTVVQLFGTGLHAIGQQDGWVTSCDADHYPQTRTWAVAIRDWSPMAAGFAWHPRHDNDRLAFVFFGDRLSIDSLKSGRTHRAATRAGRRIIATELHRYHALLA